MKKREEDGKEANRNEGKRSESAREGRQGKKR